jgi:hypothetical protein
MKNKELKDFIYKNVYQNTSSGYVLTPSELAYDMVSTLPSDTTKSETTTFLDPICKSGTLLFEVAEKLYDEGHSINNIQSRLFTIDSNSHSLNVAESFIKKILNKESGAFKVDYKHEFIEKYYNRLIFSISNGKHTTFDDFLSIIMLDKSNKYLMKELQKNISSFIEQYEKVSKLESKLFGEVFTPRQLIDEMLDTLPKEVWSNPDLKWLDPAVGIGNFPAPVLDRLMIGLESVITNEDDRKKHILEEMLHFCDISVKNLFLLYKLFDCNNEFKLNVYRGSFLTPEPLKKLKRGEKKPVEGFYKHMKEVWDLNGFDVILTNPPYQDGSKDGGQNKVYTLFCRDSLNLLNENGKLLFVTPTSVLKESKRFTLVNNKNLKMVNFDANKYFNVGIEICSWLVDKSYTGPVMVKSNNEIIETSSEQPIFDLNKIDKYYVDIYNAVMKITKNQKSANKRMFKRNNHGTAFSKNKTDKHIYDIYSVNRGVEGLTWTSRVPIFHGERKLIVPNTKALNLNNILIDTKDYGPSYFAIKLENDEQIDNILSFVLSESFIDLYSVFRNIRGGMNSVLIDYCPIFDINKKWTNEEVKNYFENL